MEKQPFGRRRKCFSERVRKQNSGKTCSGCDQNTNRVKKIKEDTGKCYMFA